MHYTGNGNSLNFESNYGVRKPQRHPSIQHGCGISIESCTGEGIIHRTAGCATTPTVRSYKDGIKVGCTFVSNEALEKIYKWHRNFIDWPSCTTHQKGEE